MMKLKKHLSFTTFLLLYRRPATYLVEPATRRCQRTIGFLNGGGGVMKRSGVGCWWIVAVANTTIASGVWHELIVIRGEKRRVSKLPALPKMRVAFLKNRSSVSQKVPWWLAHCNCPCESILPPPAVAPEEATHPWRSIGTGWEKGVDENESEWWKGIQGCNVCDTGAPD